MPAFGAAPLQDLLHRSHRLGGDKRITNFAGGNTSAKLELPDPVTGESARVLAVKGSGGDLATLDVAGVATLLLERVLALERVHRGGVPEDDMVDLYAACRFGDGGAVPSIDTIAQGRALMFSVPLGTATLKVVICPTLTSTV